MARRYLVLFAILFLMAGCSGSSGVSNDPRVAGPPGAMMDNAGNSGNSSDSSSVQTGNTAPQIRQIWFVGGDGTPGNTLGVEFEAFDADGDAVQVAIAWEKNGEPAGAGSRLPAAIRRDDKITVTLTPSDGKTTGRPVTLTRTILNSPPAIEGHDQFQFDGDNVTFQVHASDADGDPLTYVLKDAPAGMVIDRKTGRIRWPVSPETVGRIPFTVEVSDGVGGSTTAQLAVTIAPQPDSKE